MATSIMNGRKNPKELIFDMLVFGTDESKSMSVIPKAESSVAGGSSKQPKQISLSPQELFHNDRLYKPGTTYDFNSVNAKTIMKATATAVGPLFSLNKSGATIGQSIITDILENGNFEEFLNRHDGIEELPKKYVVYEDGKYFFSRFLGIFHCST